MSSTAFISTGATFAACAMDVMDRKQRVIAIMDSVRRDAKRARSIGWFLLADAGSGRGDALSFHGNPARTESHGLVSTVPLTTRFRAPFDTARAARVTMPVRSS